MACILISVRITIPRFSISFFPTVINKRSMFTSHMSYQETVNDIEKEFGSFPGFLRGVPQDVLMHMWPIMKRYILGESKIPPKYREMIGLAVAATLKCPYCEIFHKGAAQMNREQQMRNWQKWQHLLDRLLFGVMYFMHSTMTSIRL